MNDQEEEDFRFVVEVEGEEASSESLIVTRELKHLSLLEIPKIRFNHDSTVMLPDALSDLACCYLTATKDPSKLVLIGGHTDSSGPPLYNEWLAKRRAENILNILLGNRQKWIDSVTTQDGPILKPEGKITPSYQPKGKSKVEDYQEILNWTATKYGWLCDPGTPSKTNNTNWHIYARSPKIKKAIEVFQKKYNDELAAQVGDNSIAIDGDMGPETWGAIFDVYMLELAELLGHYKVVNECQIPDISCLENYRKNLNFIDDDHQIVSSGEAHARDPKQYSPDDRRVHIMFFDPTDKPKLDFNPDCHEGLADKILGNPKRYRQAKEKANECELYGRPGIYGKACVTCDLDRTLFIEVLDYEGNHMGDVPVRIELVGGGLETEKTNANGVLIHVVKTDGTYIVSVDTQNRKELRRFKGVVEEVEVGKEGV